MAPALTLNLRADDGTTEAQFSVRRAVIAGWTSRDQAGMEKHIVELEALGVARPAKTPLFYRVSASRITTDGRIEAIGSASSGEVEFVLANIDGEIWVGVGSDHTDREAETVGVTLSKQMCDKPIAAEFWRLRDVAGHWADLQLKSTATIDGERVLYQEGPVTAMLAPEDLIARFADDDPASGFAPGDIMMCGTLSALVGIRPAAHFEIELVDPVRERRIAHGYDIVELPIAG